MIWITAVATRHSRGVSIRPMFDSDFFPPGQDRYKAIGAIADELPRVIAALDELEPILTAVRFASLLTKPELHANRFRLETLVHLAICYCRGEQKPSSDTLQSIFALIGTGYCGMMEDPSEDIFVEIVSTDEGNFRVFDDALEGGPFLLQRIVNLTGRMPSQPEFNGLRESVRNILKLLDEVVRRAGVESISGIPCAVRSRFSRWLV